MTAASERGGHFEDLRFILKGCKRELAGLLCLSLLGAVAEAFLLAAIVQSVSSLGAGDRDLEIDLGPVSLAGDVQFLLFLALIAALVRAVMVGIVSFIGPGIAAASRRRMRQRLFGAYLSADWATQSADRTGRLMQTFSASVNEANTLILMLTNALPAFITLVVLLALAVALNPLVAVVFIAVGLLVGSGLRPLSKRANTHARADAAARQETAAHVTGVMAAGAEVSVMGAGKRVLSVANRHIGDAEHAFARAQGYKRVVSMTAQSAAFILATLGLWVLSVGGWRVDYAIVGTIAVMLLRGAGLAQQVQSASSLYGSVVPFVQQVRELTDHYERSREEFGAQDFPAAFDVTLNSVGYTYPGTGDEALDVEAAVWREGQFVAILGPSGSGKSTLIQVVLRLRRPTRGSVRIGGVDAVAIREDSFSSHVAYVPQNPHLVPGTVMENIQFFRPEVTEEAAMAAARLANVHDEIERMPDGYQTVLDSHVSALSGGQRQRLSLARALTSNPRLLVLDEPTSALDAANEAAIIETLVGLRGCTTVVMITHKTATVELCDAVYVVERGVLRKVDRDRPPAWSDQMPTGGATASADGRATR